MSNREQVTEQEELRVSTLELFFDLVFVFTLTQLTQQLATDLSWDTAGHALPVFVLLFWMYAGYAYLTNQVPPDRPSRRLLLIVGMWAFLVCALAIPGAFADSGWIFGVGYLVVVLVHSGLYVVAYGRSVGYFVPPNLFAAGLVLAGGIIGGRTGQLLWVVAILVHMFAVPILSRFGSRIAGGDEQPRAGRVMNIGHFVERHGLLLIVAFGESVIAIGIGLEGVRLDLSTLVVALLGLVLATALWWAFFARDDEGSAEALLAMPPERRFGPGLGAYFYAFVPMLLGVVVLAAGVKKSIGHLGDDLKPGPAIALAGGITLYLLGQALFRLILGLPGVWHRVVPAVLCGATAALGVGVTAGAQFAALVLVLVGMLLADTRVPTQTENSLTQTEISPT